MTDYRLHIRSFIGFVSWARHYTGRVTADPAPLCCGSTSHFNAPDHRGKTVCDNGHEIPHPVEWDVERPMSREHIHAWIQDETHKLKGPTQFDSEDAVRDRAMIMFLDGVEGDDRGNQHVEPAQQGDRLFDEYGDLLAECNRG